MKKRTIIIIILLAILAIGLRIYRYNYLKNIEPVNTEENNSNLITADLKFFSGVIEEIDGDKALVYITNGEILLSGNKVYINLKDENLTSGIFVYVTYTGEIKESYPLQIEQLSISEIVASGTVMEITNSQVHILSGDIVTIHDIININDVFIDAFIDIIKTDNGNKAVIWNQPGSTDCETNTWMVYDSPVGDSPLTNITLR